MVRRTEVMECPVCYCEDACCHLVCGHSFCQGCTKEWWLKSTEPSCPMCRAPLYFKGMRKVAERWENEKDQQIKETVYSRIFDEILEFMEDREFDHFEAEFAMIAIRDFDERFNLLTQDPEWVYEEEELYDLASDIMLTVAKQKIEWETADVLPSQKLMFVPKDKRSVYRPFRLARDRATHTPPMDLYAMFLVV